MFEGLFWIFIAFLIFAPACLGFYLLVTSTDKLTVSYQNFQLKRTAMPLKDEDFSNMPRVIFRLKLTGFFLIAFSVSVMVYALM